MSMRTEALTTSSAWDSVVGEGSLEDEVRGNLVKGNLINSRAWYLREHHGPAVLAEVARALSEEARAYLLQPSMTFAWRPFGPLIDVDAAIVRHAMGGDTAMMKPFGALIALHDLPTIYKVFFKVGTPSFLMSKVSLACGMYFKDTTLRSETVSPNRTVVTLVGRSWPLYLCAYGMQGFLEAGVDLSGGMAPTAKHTSCVHRGDVECRWDVRWR